MSAGTSVEAEWMGEWLGATILYSIDMFESGKHYKVLWDEGGKTVLPAHMVRWLSDGAE